MKPSSLNWLTKPYSPCYATRGTNKRNQGRFASGKNVPKAGSVHWGWSGYILALCDCLIFKWRYRSWDI